MLINLIYRQIATIYRDLSFCRGPRYLYRTQMLEANFAHNDGHCGLVGNLLRLTWRETQN